MTYGPRTTIPAPPPLADRITGTVLACYPCGDPTDRAKHAITIAQPSAVMLHQGPDGLVKHGVKMAAAVRSLSALVRLMVGIGCDYWAGLLVAGRIDVDTAVAELMKAVDVAAAIRAIAVVLDLEGAAEGLKAHPITAHFMERLIATIRARYEHIIIGHTAYDCPVAVIYVDTSGRRRSFGGHGQYPWPECCGPDGAEILFPQVYWPTGNGSMAPAGSGPWRLARHEDSWAAAIGQGLIAPDRQHAVYVQGHGSTVEDTCDVADRFSLRAFWAENGNETFDANGLTSLRVMCALESRGLDLETFQRQADLKPDRIVGPKTLSALGIH